MNSSHDITNILTCALYLIISDANVNTVRDAIFHSYQLYTAISAYRCISTSWSCASCLMQLLFTRVVPLPLLVNKPLHKSSVQAKVARISLPS
jgi:hypothetical protein